MTINHRAGAHQCRSFQDEMLLFRETLICWIFSLYDTINNFSGWHKCNINFYLFADVHSSVHPLRSKLWSCTCHLNYYLEDTFCMTGTCSITLSNTSETWFKRCCVFCFSISDPKMDDTLLYFFGHFDFKFGTTTDHNTIFMLTPWQKVLDPSGCWPRTYVQHT